MAAHRERAELGAVPTSGFIRGFQNDPFHLRQTSNISGLFNIVLIFFKFVILPRSLVTIANPEILKSIYTPEIAVFLHFEAR